MSTKNLFIISLLALVPHSMFGMEQVPAEAQEPDSKRVCVANSLEQDQEENLAAWGMELKAYMSNFDVVGVRAQLMQAEGSHMTRQEKESLFDEASKREHLMVELTRMGSNITQDATNFHVIQKFSFDDESKQATRIKHLLNAFRFLKGFRFPQALFTPQPYKGNPAQSLDKVLETLIANEQSHISVCCFHLTLYNVAKCLVEQKNTEHITIDMVTNRSQGENVPLQSLKLLVNSGISVVAPKNHDHENNHHKFFIFTSNVTNNALVWSGSYNPTGHGNKNSWDDVTIIDDAGVVQSFRDRFDQIKAASSAITQAELDCITSKPSLRSLDSNVVPKELWPQ